jgi:hypothetical protein
MAYLAYLFRRVVAIALGLALTAYSAWASWTHQGDLIGPLAALSAAVLLAFCEYAWRDRRWVHFGLLGLLGLAAAAISGSIVLERISHSQEVRSHTARSANLPRQEAQKALAEAQQALKAAEAEASDACGSGRGPVCKGLEQRETAARQRVAEARSKLVGLGAETVVDPAGGILGAHAETFRLVVLLGLPLWLELAAPVVLAYGFAPAPCKEVPALKQKVRRRGKPTRAPKPAGPPVKAAAQSRLKLVAANDQ